MMYGVAGFGYSTLCSLQSGGQPFSKGEIEIRKRDEGRVMIYF